MRGLEENSTKEMSKPILAESGDEFQLRCAMQRQACDFSFAIPSRGRIELFAGHGVEG